MKNSKTREGFSLLELLIVISIVIVLTSIFIRSSSPKSTSSKIQTEELLSFVNSARTTAIARGTSTHITTEKDNFILQYQDIHSLKITKQYLPKKINLHGEPINILFSSEGIPDKPQIIDLDEKTRLIIPRGGTAFLDP